MASENLMQTFSAEMRVSREVPEQDSYNSLLRTTLDTFIEQLCSASEDMSDLYWKLYYSGSYYDDLKVGSTGQEFDLNIVLDIIRDEVEVVGLGEDKAKPNFAYLRFVGDPNEAENEILERSNRCSGLILSPKKIFSMLQTAGDRALRRMNNEIEHEGYFYRVTRSIGAPFTLKISGNGMDMEVDLVPAIELNIQQLGRRSRVRQRLNRIRQKRGKPFKSTTCMAICLWKADSDRFEIDFHDLEREILKLDYPNVVKPIIRMLKVMRDLKGGPLAPLWSHLIKTSVMHSVLKHRSHDFWNERDLVDLFELCLRELYEALEAKTLTDLFFTEYNMMSRLSKKEIALDQATRFIDRQLRKLEDADEEDRESAVILLVLG